jgi:hypothetical protein
MRVKRADLGSLVELAEGGYGKVYGAPQYHLPGDPVAIVFKAYTTAVAEQARAAENAVSFRNRLDPADRADLDRCTLWPRALVEDRGAVAGLLMPLIPSEFFFEATDHATGGKSTKLRDLQWLIAAPAILADHGIADIDNAERLVLLGHLVYAVGLLHEHGWVYGDLSFKNVAFALGPPRIILLGCDDAADLRDPRRKQAHSIFWEPPESAQVSLQNKASDVYKLGLAILRCLSPGNGASTARDPSRLADRLDAAGVALISRAVGPDPARRPTAGELYAYLYGIVPDSLKARMPPAGGRRAQVRPLARVRSDAPSGGLLRAGSDAETPTDLIAGTGAPGGRVFISYRREDAGYPAGWLFDQLAAHLGADRVFKDVDSIEPGDDFVEVITAAVASCAVLLAVIGDRWLMALGQDGRRLDDPGDFVRLEIEAALARGVRVVPVLVGGAPMPRPDQLPTSLAGLARRQAIELSHARFSSDLAGLLKVLYRILGSASAQ